MIQRVMSTSRAGPRVAVRRMARSSFSALRPLDSCIFYLPPISALAMRPSVDSHSPSSFFNEQDSPVDTSDIPITSTSQSEQPESSIMPGSTTTPSQLFDTSFIPNLPPLQALILALYFPIGICVAVTRMMLWLGGVLLDLPIFRNQTIVNLWKRLIGYQVEWKNKERIPTTRHVMVSNHTSPGDLCFLFDFEPRYTHLITSSMPAVVTKKKNLPAHLHFATPTVIDELSSSSSSVHLFPEGGVTNGRVGMMQFSRGFCNIIREGQVVVPVVLRTKTAFDIRSHTLTSSFLSNLFWMSFAPWTTATAEVLPPMAQMATETRAEFAKRVQQAISDASRLAISDINITGKRRLMDQSSKGRGQSPINTGSRRRPEPNCGVSKP